MRGFRAIAFTTFRELIRERVVLGIGGMALFLVVISLLLGELGIDERERMIADFSFFATEIAVVALALVLGSTALSKEIERQTCLLVLARPVSRFQFIAAKTFGLGLLLIFVVFILCGTTQILLANPFPALWTVALTILMKSFLILAWTVLASNFVRPILAFMFGFVLYLLGHWLGDLQFLAIQGKNEAMIEVVRNLRWIVPSFDLYNWKTYFDLVNPPAFRDILGMLMQTIAWSGIGVSLSGLAFSRRDIV